MPTADVEAEPARPPQRGDGLGGSRRSMRPARPARPPWRDFFLIRRVFGAGILDGLTFLHRRYGAFVQTRLPLELYFVSAPATIEEILLKKADAFRKDRTSRLLSRVIGNGLLINDGESWRRQRRLLQPAFHQRQLEAYADAMVTAAEGGVASWGSGEVRNVHDDMMAVTLNIVAATLFGADLRADTREIGRIVSGLMEEFGRLLGLAARYYPPAWVPTRANRRFRASARQIDNVILGLIEARRNPKPGDRRDDVLSILIDARDEGGAAMTDAQVRDEAVTLFLAGHETTALALTYALHLLSRHPASQERARAEIEAALGDRRPGFTDVERLPYLQSVLLESMRLYPPVWVIARQAREPVEIGGYRFGAGAEFVMSPWVVHRDGAVFPRPDVFDPSRWENNLAQRLPRFAYFPFGGGPRVCIGNRFAMMEATLVLAVVLSRFRVEPATAEPTLDLMPSVTLRPRRGLPLRVVRQD
ncbi:MAG TPA: cytochrome P450 [Polyangia bacterium]|nr:cytochrome P450 [Polyangia bacterium]